MDSTSLEKLKDCIAEGQRFVLTTHVNPDGDGLGSEAALAAYLEGLGKNVLILNHNPVPQNYDFLDANHRMRVYDSTLHRETVLTSDFVVVVDISDWGRLRELGKDIRDTGVKIICIDHHPSQETFGDIRLIDTRVSSTGELVYDFLTFCNAVITKPMAEALYTSILTDTGSFKFSNTTAKCLKIASELVGAGANPQEIFHRIYERQSRGKLKLLAYVLNNLHFEEDGKLVWFKIPQHVMENLGARASDTEGFADYPRVVDGVEVSIMFNEMENGKVKVSLRSKGNYVINGIAQKFGGGGHAFAAGALLDNNGYDYTGALLEEVARLLKY